MGALGRPVKRNRHIAKRLRIIYCSRMTTRRQTPDHPIRRWLSEHQEEQQTLAARARLDPTTLSRILSGRRKARLDHALALQRATRGSVLWTQIMLWGRP